MITQVATKSKPLGSGAWNASDSPKKFIPKKPARNDIGRNITVTIVRVFMMSFVRMPTTAKCISNRPLTRSR